MKQFAVKIITAATVAVVSAFLYEQARKVGQKSDWLVKFIEDWDKRHNRPGPVDEVQSYRSGYMS